MTMDDSQKINDDNSVKELMAKFQTLSTFAEVSDWSNQAENEIERISAIIRKLDVEIARDTETLERIKYEHAKKSLVGRLFGAGNDEKELSQHIEQYRQSKSELIKAAMQMQESIDFTPKSPEEQKVLIQEIRQRKKEIQEKRRENTMVIRGPRADVTEQNAQARAIFGVAMLERRAARYARDAEPLPQEKPRESVDRQMAQFDREILWAEKFK